MRDFVRTLVAGALVIVSATVTGAASGQSPAPDELSAGRQLFAEALDDEEHQRYAAAIEKYQRVLKVRDTPSIRFRMGTTFEGLGKVTSAIDAYNAAIRTSSKSGTAADAEIARASQARIDVLEPKVAHLALRPRATAPTELRIDNEPVGLEHANDLRLDPGAHVVDATAPNTQPFHVQVTLSEGARAELPIVFEAKAGSGGVGNTTPPGHDTSGLRTAGIVTGAAGALLLVGGAVVLLLRSGAISELHESCPNGDCPRAREQELRDTRDRAVFQGPLGATLLGVGAAALGTGIVLYLLGRDAKTAATLRPSGSASFAGLILVKAF